MENKEKQVRKIAQRVMTKYKLHPPVDMMGLIQEKGITCVEENLGTNADGYSDLKDSDLKIVLNSAIQYEPRKRFTLGKNSIQEQEEMQDKQILLESLMHIHFCQ